MSALVHAVSAFFDHLAAVHWRYLGIAILCHALRCIPVSRAWRNTLARAYEGERVRWRDVLLGYLAGNGINAVIPARVGDAVKLYILKRRINTSTYTTLASTLVVLNIFDFACALVLFLWASSTHVLPSIDVLGHIPRFDFTWFFAHPRVTLAILAFLAAAGLVAGIWAWGHVVDFKNRVSAGFAIVRDFGAYMRHVAAWQAVDWGLRLFAIYWFLRAFGIPANAPNALKVQVTQSLSTLFPFSPSGIGTEQALALYVLAGQAGRSAVLAFSVGMHLALIVINLVLGIAAIAIALRTFRIRAAAAAARRSRSEAAA
jgi:uncharacterized membrane protein YbhN (UPF0104 family)